MVKVLFSITAKNSILPLESKKLENEHFEINNSSEIKDDTEDENEKYDIEFRKHCLTSILPYKRAAGKCLNVKISESSIIHEVFSFYPNQKINKPTKNNPGQTVKALCTQKMVDRGAPSGCCFWRPWVSRGESPVLT